MEHEVRHHTIVVVDVEGFGDRRRTNPHQRGVREGLYTVVQRAFDVAGVPWASCYHEDRGDAVFILAPASTPKSIFVETLPPAMINALRVHNDTHPDAQRIRLRMALHAGEVHYDDHGVTSASLTLAFRLIEAKPLKAALAASPGVLAIITSDWFFDDVVRHSPGAAPATYRQVSVTEKETRTTGWITLPDHPYSAERHGEPKSWVVPRQLPLAVRDFTGRAEHVAALDNLIPEREGTPPVVITAVDGTAGIGKTTLAVHWAHRVQHRFPDGTLHVNLRGYGPGDPATPGEVLDGFLRALDTPAEKMPVGVDAQAALYRSLLDGRRVLIVLDNANSADQVRPLLPASAGCMVIVTSRDSLTGLVVTEVAHRLTLDLLTPPEALHLVTGIIGHDRAALEPDAVDDLVRLCARLPLALRIAAGKVAAHPHITVAEVVAELADEHDRLSVLSRGGDERAAVRAVFDWSYQRLPDEQARLFRRLGLHPGPDLSVPAAAAVAELEPARARELLDDLAEAHLIEPTARTRYRFHDLLRAYAAEQARRQDHADDRDRARRALLSWYAHTARTCDELTFPAHYRLSLQLPTPMTPTSILDRTQALGWLNGERHNLHAALHSAISHGLHSHAMHLTNAMRFLYLLGSWDELLDAVTYGLRSARDCGDTVAETFFLIVRGETLADLRRWGEAQSDCDEALTLASALSDPMLQVGALNALGHLFCSRDHFDDALPYLQEALPLAKQIDTGRWEALVEGNLGRALIGLGRYRQALEHDERGLALRRRIGDSDGEVVELHQLARAWQGLGQHEKSIRLCHEAIAIGRTAGNPAVTVAEPLEILGVSLHHSGNTAEAITCWREAAELFDEYGYPHKAAEMRQRIHTVE